MASAQPGGGASAAGSDAAGADTGPEAVADLIADELDRLGGPARQRLAEVLHQLGAIDRAVYAAVAAVPAPALDTAMRRLSNSANHSRLWLAIAGALALTGPAGRRSASRGAPPIGITSALVNLGVKAPSARPPPSRSPQRSAGTAPGWPSRSSSWPGASPTPGSTLASTTPAIPLPGRSSAPAPARPSAASSTAP